MQAIQLIEICLAALGGGVVGALGHRYRARQQLATLQQRLLRSEEARNGAIERSATAREQIAQLSKAISELRRSNHPARAATDQKSASTAEDRRAAAERALAAASGGVLINADAKGPPMFAATQPMQY